MPSQTSPKAQAVVAILILALSVSLYLWPNEQSENTISKDLSQASLKKLPLAEWRVSENPEPSRETEPYNQPQEGIQNFKQAVVEPLNNWLGINQNNQEDEDNNLLFNFPEAGTQNTSEKQSIYATHTVTPDCYREGEAGSIGTNVIATCCNCGLARGRRDRCNRAVADCGHNGENCCIQLGCLNKECPGKPAIWDPATGECGC